MVNGQSSIDNWLLTIDNYLGSGFEGLGGGVAGFDSDFAVSADEPELFSVDGDSDLELADEELAEDPDFL